MDGAKCLCLLRVRVRETAVHLDVVVQSGEEIRIEVPQDDVAVLEDLDAEPVG